jgi:drug/metabolite transporter (DMT)-like permease
VRRIGAEERSVVLLLYPLVANFVIMGAAIPFVYQPMPVQDLGRVALTALLAFAAMNCMIYAYRHAEAALIAPMQYSQILWALFYGALLFQETPSRTTLIGAGIVIVSGLYIVFRESRAGVSATTPVLRSRSRVGTPAALRVGPVLRLRGWIR